MSSCGVAFMLVGVAMAFVLGLAVPIIAFSSASAKACTYEKFSLRKRAIGMSLILLLLGCLVFQFFMHLRGAYSESMHLLALCLFILQGAALSFGLKLGYMTAFFNDLDRWTKPKR